MVRKTFIYLVGVLIGSGCHSNASIVPPPTDGAKSQIVMMFIGDEPVRVHATDIPGQYPVSTYRESTELFVLSYSCPLDVMRLTDGGLSFGEEPEKIQLPPPIQVRESVFDGDMTAPWTEAEALDTRVEDILKRLTLDDDHLCRVYDIELSPSLATFTASSTTTETPTFAIPLGPLGQELFLATADRQFYRISSTGAATPLTFETRDETGTSTHAPAMAAFRRSDSEIWLFDEDGRLAHGNLQQGFDILTTTTSSSRLRGFDGARAGPLEILALTSSIGRPLLRRFDGTRWERLLFNEEATENKRDGSYSTLHQVVWVGPNEFVVAGLDGHIQEVMGLPAGVVRVRSGVLTSEPLPEKPAWAAGESEASVAVFNIPDMGLVVGTTLGYLLRFDGERWVRLENSLMGDQPHRIGYLGNGVLLAGSSSKVYRYHPVGGVCGVDTVSYVARVIEQLEEGKAIIFEGGWWVDSTKVHATILTRLGSTPSCLPTGL